MRKVLQLISTLLLPFGSNGHVQVILASLQLISLHGTVSRRDAVRNFEAHCESVVSITNQPPASQSSTSALTKSVVHDARSSSGTSPTS